MKKTLPRMMYWVQATIQILLARSDQYANLQEGIDKEFPIDESLYSEVKHGTLLERIKLFFRFR